MSLRQSCPDSVLSILSSDGPLGFEEIVKRVDRSRGTVNNHIRKLHNEGLVKQETGRGAHRYYLSKKGKAAAGKLALAKQASQIVYEGKTAGQIKSEFEEIQRIINLAQSRYPTNLNAFFSCYAELTTKTPVGILKDPDSSQK